MTARLPDWLVNSRFGRIDPAEWILKTPFGPMVHRDTGETYQARGARLEHEHQQRLLQQPAPAGRRHLSEE